MFRAGMFPEFECRFHGGEDGSEHRRADPFGERQRLTAFRARLLGGRFEFETDSAELRRLVESVYARLPQHRASSRAPRFRVRLRLDELEARKHARGAPPVELIAGGRMLAGAAAPSSFAVMAPECHSAIVNVSRDLLRFPHNVRYELIEFAVFTLAARALGLVPLHAGCVGLRRRGLLLIGDSGAGKSTLTLQCALAGLDFLAEDSVLVAPGTLRATGVPNFAHVCRDGLKYLPPPLAASVRRAPRIRRRSGATKFEIDLRDPVFKLAEPPLSLFTTVFLSTERARAGKVLAPLSRRETRARLYASQPYGAAQRGWTEFCHLMTRRPAFELKRTAHPAGAAAVLKSLLIRERG